VVSHSNAVVDPWAMMIESFNTLMADSAVSTPYSSEGLTYRTELGRIEFLNKFNELNSRSHIARVTESTNNEKENSQASSHDISYDQWSI
jgi:hypothetical protein